MMIEEVVEEAEWVKAVQEVCHIEEGKEHNNQG